MAKYRVHFTKITEISVPIEADSYEDAIEAAYDEMPSEPCAQCCGWGQRWSRDESGEPEVEVVYNEDTGDEAYTAPDQWQRVTVGTFTS